MPRPCTVCTHPQRRDIDQALVLGNMPNTGLSSVFDVTEAAIRRHTRDHVPRQLVQAQAAAEVAQADDLLGQLRDLQARTLVILDGAEREGKWGAAVAAVNAARANLELLGELLHELDRRPQVNLILAPEWTRLRVAIITALSPYPEATTAVSEALAGLEAGEVTPS